MNARSGGLTLGVGIPLAVVAGLAALGSASPDADPGARVGVLAFGLVLGLLAVRIIRAGIEARPDAIVVRSAFWSRRLAAPDVAGLTVFPAWRGRRAGLGVVGRDGAVVSSPFAVWKMGSPALRDTVIAAVHAGPPTAVEDTDEDRTTAATVLEQVGRLHLPAAFTVARYEGLVAVPAATAAPGLTPETVDPVADDGARRFLRLETVAVATAFVLPALAAAVTVLSRHLEGVSELDEFDLPLPHNPAGSLLLMLLLYASTAVVTPLALLLLARSGQSPRSLHLRLRDLARDIGPALSLLGAAWLMSFALALALKPLLEGSASTSSTNTSVPAYFVIYALFVSAVTAINEELIVNAYLMTRLSQLAWRPWPALALSLTLRTSYHAYYGLALLLTVPFGFVATRSFQRSGRIGRAIIAHFVNDAILLTVAVLTS